MGNVEVAQQRTIFYWDTFSCVLNAAYRDSNFWWILSSKNTLFSGRGM